MPLPTEPSHRPDKEKLGRITGGISQPTLWRVVLSDDPGKPEVIEMIFNSGLGQQ